MTTLKPLYFAAPLFSQAEIEFNLRLVTKLEAIAPVFLPQRDGGLASALIEGGTSRARAFSDIAATDIAAIDNCAIVVAVLDGQTVDDGVAFELGYAYAMKKPCLALQTDSRRTTLGFCNPLIQHSLIFVANNEAEILSMIKHLLCTQLGPDDQSDSAKSY